MSNKYIKLSLKTTNEEKLIIDRYFKSNPNLKKGETIKSWIIATIRNIEGLGSEQALDLRKQISEFQLSGEG